MAPKIFDFHGSGDPSDAIYQAVEVLAAGKVLAIPTETVYGLAASALCPDAVAKLCEIKTASTVETEGVEQGSCDSRHPDSWRPMAIAVKSAEDALDYVPNMPPLGRRLARRCWPGPLTIVFPNDSQESVLTRLPRSVQSLIGKDGTIGIRVPANDVLLKVLRYSRGPLILSSANRRGDSEVKTASDVAETLGAEVEFILDGGPTKFGRSSTVVKIEGDHCDVLRSGVIAVSTLKRMANFTALMVCTGNTCRSPMAECLLKKHLAARLGCRIDQLPEFGVNVVSAGVAAYSGQRASGESVHAMARRNLDLSLHESQSVTDTLVSSADLILTMTGSHRRALLGQWPEAAEKTFTVSGGRHDVSDPIGGSPEMYESCASQIDQYLKDWAEKAELHLPEGLDS